MSQLPFTEINAGWIKNVLQPILSGHWCVENCLYKVFSLLLLASFQEWTVVVASPGNVGWTLLGQMFIVVMGKELWYSHIIGWCYGTRDLLCNHDLWLNIERMVVRLEICSWALYFTLLSILLNKKIDTFQKESDIPLMKQHTRVCAISLQTLWRQRKLKRIWT